jgi:hypothetical protein
MEKLAGTIQPSVTQTGMTAIVGFAYVHKATSTILTAACPEVG